MVDPNAALSSALRRGTLEFCVLALIEDDERYGVEIVKALSSEPVLATSEGTLYPLLSRLRRSGQLVTSWRESPSGPPRRYYSLSPHAHESLAAFRREWAAYSDAVNRLVGKAPE